VGPSGPPAGCGVFVPICNAAIQDGEPERTERVRNQVLIRSVRRLLGDDVVVHHVVTMWRRHPLAIPFCAGAFVVGFVVAALVDIQPLSSQVAVGLAGLAVAAMATTDQRILVQTDADLVMVLSSKIRQYAKAIIGSIPGDAVIEVVSDNLVISDWMIGDQRFSMMKRSQRAMTHIVAARRDGGAQ